MNTEYVKTQNYEIRETSEKIFQAVNVHFNELETVKTKRIETEESEKGENEKQDKGGGLSTSLR